MDTSIEQRVKRVVAEQLCQRVDAVHNDSTFESLGGDSLDQIEIVMALEDEFELQIDDACAEQIKTVQQAIDYITGERAPA